MKSYFSAFKKDLFVLILLICSAVTLAIYQIKEFKWTPPSGNLQTFNYTPLFFEWKTTQNIEGKVVSLGSPTGYCLITASGRWSLSSHQTTSIPPTTGSSYPIQFEGFVRTTSGIKLFFREIATNACCLVAIGTTIGTHNLRVIAFDEYYMPSAEETSFDPAVLLCDDQRHEEYWLTQKTFLASQ